MPSVAPNNRLYLQSSTVRGTASSLAMTGVALSVLAILGVLYGAAMLATQL